MSDEIIEQTEGELPIEEPDGEEIPAEELIIEEPIKPVFDIWNPSTWTDELMPEGFDPDDQSTWPQFGWVPPEQPSTPKQPVQHDEVAELRQRIKELEDVVASQAGITLAELKAEVVK